MTRKRVTMKDIADKLNLSINAVSLALNDKTGRRNKTFDFKYSRGNGISGSVCKVYAKLFQ